MTVLQYLPRFRNLGESLDQLASHEVWSRNDIAAYQLKRINQVWDSAKTHVPYYRCLAKRHQLPASFESLDVYHERMPCLPKDQVRARPQDFMSEIAEAGKWHRTGGSTGVPTAIFWEHRAHRRVLESKYRSEQAHGLNVFDRKVFFWGHNGSFAPGLRGLGQKLMRPVEDRLRRRLRVSAYDLSPECLKRKLDVIQNFQPSSIYGYSSAIELLAQTAADQGIKIPSLKLAILTAEPADKRMLTRISEHLGCPAVIEYGAMECGLMAYQMPDGLLRTRDDLVHLETLADPDSGGYQLVTSFLGNESFPLLRYQIEDTTSSSLLIPETGFGILSDVQGRSNDLLRTRSGKRLHSMAVKHAIENHWPVVRRFTARQSHDGRLNVVLETPSPMAEGRRHSLQRQLSDLMEGYEVELETVACIAGNLAGKHRWIVNESVCSV